MIGSRERRDVSRRSIDVGVDDLHQQLLDKILVPMSIHG